MICSPQAAISIRVAVERDLPRLTKIYNHYVINSAITFDIEPYSVERRATWFAQFAPTGRHSRQVLGRGLERTSAEAGLSLGLDEM
jgi:L-amino acid N-acyltransferase YncA